MTKSLETVKQKTVSLIESINNLGKSRRDIANYIGIKEETESYNVGDAVKKIEKHKVVKKVLGNEETITNKITTSD